MTKKIFYSFLIMIFIIAVSFYSVAVFASDHKKKEIGNLNICTTTSMIRDAVENIGKDKVNISCLMEGADPHQYQASNSDLAKITESDIVFYGGLNLEAKLSKVLKKCSEYKCVVNTSKDITNNELLLFDHGENEDDGEQDEECPYDPHIWFDINLWKKVCNTIKNTLCDKDTVNKNYYEENFVDYMQKLDELAVYVKNKVEEISQEKRKVITSHDAFQYFGRYTNIQFHGIQGVTTDSESSGYDIFKIIKLIMDEKIKCIFMENTVPPKLILSVIESLKTLKYDIKLGEELYSDSLGPVGEEEGTYIGMYKSNIDSIINNLK